VSVEVDGMSSMATFTAPRALMLSGSVRVAVRKLISRFPLKARARRIWPWKGRQLLKAGQGWSCVTSSRTSGRHEASYLQTMNQKHFIALSVGVHLVDVRTVGGGLNPWPCGRNPAGVVDAKKTA